MSLMMMKMMTLALKWAFKSINKLARAQHVHEKTGILKAEFE